jgi:hypothetical protein
MLRIMVAVLIDEWTGLKNTGSWFITVALSFSFSVTRGAAPGFPGLGGVCFGRSAHAATSRSARRSACQAAISSSSQTTVLGPSATFLGNVLAAIRL